MTLWGQFAFIFILEMYRRNASHGIDKRLFFSKSSLVLISVRFFAY